MSSFSKMETFVYKHLVVPLQGKHTFDFVGDIYIKGNKVLDFGSGIGTNSKLFNHEDYIGVDVDHSRVEESRRTFPEYEFKEIPYISSDDDHLPFPDHSFDFIFVSLCLHHVDSNNCKVLFKEFRRLLKRDGVIIGIEPVVTKNIFSNIFMNLIDGGDYILRKGNYKEMYASESFHVDSVNIVTAFGYHLWQYKAKTLDSDSSHPFSSKITDYRRFIKPFNQAILYGKWVMVFYLGYILSHSIWLKFNI